MARHAGSATGSGLVDERAADRQDGRSRRSSPGCSRSTCSTSSRRSSPRGPRCSPSTPPSTARCAAASSRSARPCSACWWRSRSGSVFGLNALSLGLAMLVGLHRRLGARAARRDHDRGGHRARGPDHRRERRPEHAARRGCSTPASASPSACSSTCVVWPPLRDRSAAHQIDALDDRIGELLSRDGRGCGRRPGPTAGSRARASSTPTSTAPGASCGRRARAAG